MSILSNKDKGGNSSSFALNQQVLNGLQKIADNTDGSSALLISLLAAVKAHQEMEILLVRDTGDSNKIVAQIREYDEETATWLAPVYEVAGGGTHTVVGPLEYMDPSAVLNLLLTEILEQGTVLDAMLLDTAALVAKDFATETTLASVLADTTVVATPETLLAKNIQRVTVGGVNTVPAGKRRVSFYNADKPEALVDGVAIKRGEVFTFVADGLRDTLGSFTYNCLTSELVIITIG